VNPLQTAKKIKLIKLKQNTNSPSLPTNHYKTVTCNATQFYQQAQALEPLAMLSSYDSQLRRGQAADTLDMCNYIHFF